MCSLPCWHVQQRRRHVLPKYGQQQMRLFCGRPILTYSNQFFGFVHDSGCAVNTYSGAGAGSCTACPANSVTANGGSTTKSACQCSPGYSGPNGGPCTGTVVILCCWTISSSQAVSQVFGTPRRRECIGSLHGQYVQGECGQQLVPPVPREWVVPGGRDRVLVQPRLRWPRASWAVHPYVLALNVRIQTFFLAC